jgi:hypothetical protein
MQNEISKTRFFALLNVPSELNALISDMTASLSETAMD